jgi:hypothetical protein
MKKEASSFYEELKFGESNREKLKQEKIANNLKEIKKGREKSAALKDLADGAKQVIKSHPKAVEGAVAGGILGAGSELVMPSRVDPMTGEGTTNLKSILGRGLVGAAAGGLGGEIKTRVRGRIDKLASIADKAKQVGSKLKSVADKVKNVNPMVSRGLVGAGLGGTWGNLSAKEQIDKRQVDPMTNLRIDGGDRVARTIGGALSGGAAGALSGSPGMRRTMEGLKGFLPNVSRDGIKNTLKNPVVTHGLAGGAIGAGSDYGFQTWSPHQSRDENGRLKDSTPNKMSLVPAALLGATMGATHGMTKNIRRSGERMNDFLNYAAAAKEKIRPTKKMLSSGHKVGPGSSSQKIHSYTDNGVNYDVLDKAASVGSHIKDFARTHPGAVLGGGIGAGIGGLNAALSNESKSKKLKKGLGITAGMAGLGMLTGLRNSMADNVMRGVNGARKVPRAAERFHDIKTAGVLQSAGQFLGKHPRWGGAGIGASFGLAGGALTDGDNAVPGALLMGGAGALGGRYLRAAAGSKTAPLLGQSVQKGVREGIGMANKAKMLKANPMSAAKATVNSAPAYSAASSANSTIHSAGAPMLGAPRIATPKSTNYMGMTPSTSQVIPKNPGVGMSTTPAVSPQLAKERASANMAQEVTNAYKPTRSSTPALNSNLKVQKPRNGPDLSMASSLSKIAQILNS